MALKTFQNISPHLRQAMVDWKWELFAITLASMLLLGATILLIESNGEEQSSTGLLNLNSEVAFISTALRSALVYILAQVIHQLKWSWFDQPRSLYDLERFHTAANTIWAFLPMINVVRQLHPVLFCSFFLLASYGIGPFTQQAIQSVPCTRLNSAQAAIPVSHYMESWPLDTTLGLEDRGDVIHSMSSSGAINVPVTCPTGNCNFNAINNITHSTAGVCSKCFDASELISANTTLIPVTPNVNSSINNTIPYMNLTRLVWAGDGPDIGDILASSDVFNVSRTDLNISTTSLISAAKALEPIVESIDELYRLVDISYVMLSISILSPSTFRGLGAACFIHPCVQNHHGWVENGVYTEKLVSEKPMYPRVKEPPMAAYGIQEPCVVKGKTYTAANMSSLSSENSEDMLVLPESAIFKATGPILPGMPGSIHLTNATTNVPRQCVYFIGSNFGFRLTSFLQIAFQGSCTNRVCTNSAFSRDDSIHTTTYGSAYWLEALQVPMDGNMRFETVANTISNVTRAITKVVRIKGKSSAAITADAFAGKIPTPGSMDQFSNEVAAGDAIRTTICYDIRLAWLLYSLVFLGFASWVLAAMVINSYKLREAGKPVWKASILPLLFYGIISETVTNDASHHHRGHTDIKYMEDTAEGMIVTLEERNGAIGTHKYPIKSQLKQPRWTPGQLIATGVASFGSKETLLELLNEAGIDVEDVSIMAVAEFPLIVAENCCSDVALAESIFRAFWCPIIFRQEEESYRT